MPDPNSSYSDHELELLATLRDMHADDWQFDAPPAHLWAGIEDAINEPSPAEIAPSATNSLVSRFRWVYVAASIVAVLGVGVAGLALFGDEPNEVVVTATDLTSDTLDGAPAGLRGDASVIRTADGEVIQVNIGDLQPASGEYLEVWLIRPDVSGMVSLGTARPDGRYELPTGLRIADFPIVDVSSEPYDGDPVHSGASLLRGVLPN